MTTFFLTTLRLLLFPLDCVSTYTSGTPGPQDTLSQWLRGPDAACTPWAAPEVSAVRACIRSRAGSEIKISILQHRDLS